MKKRYLLIPAYLFFFYASLDIFYTFRDNALVNFHVIRVQVALFAFCLVMGFCLAFLLFYLFCPCCPKRKKPKKGNLILGIVLLVMNILPYIGISKLYYYIANHILFFHLSIFLFSGMFIISSFYGNE